MDTTIFSFALVPVRDFSPSEQAKKALPSKVGTLDPYDPTLYNYVAHLWITICPSGELWAQGKFLFHLNKYHINTYHFGLHEGQMF